MLGKMQNISGTVVALEGLGESRMEDAALGMGLPRSAGAKRSRDDAVALRLFLRPTQHFNQSGVIASCKQNQGAEQCFPGLQSKLPQPGASTAEIAPAALKLAVEQGGTRCLPRVMTRGS